MRSRFGFISFFLLANLVFLLTNLNMYYMWQKAPANTYYPFVHGGHADYYLYLSAIRESKEGSWTTPALFTSEHTESSFWYLYFIAAGKMAAVFSLSPVLAYHLGRFISIEYLIFGIYLLSKVVLGKRLAFWGAFVGLFSTVPPLMLFPNVFPPQTIPSYWVDFDPSGRMDYLPHHAFGIASLFMTLYFLFTFLKEKKKKYLYLGLLGAFAQGLLFPPAGLVIALGFPLSLGIYLFHKAIRQKQFRVNRDDLKVVIPIVVAVLLTFAALFIMRNQSNKGFPWSQWQSWDVGLWNDMGPVNEYIILAGGAALLFSLPAILAILTQGGRLDLIFIAIWSVLPYILLPFTNTIGISRIRVAFMGNFVPLGILSVLVAKMLAHKFAKKIKPQLFLGAAFALFLLISFPVTIYYLKGRVTYVPIGFINLHIPQSIMESIDYLGKNSKPYSVVLGADYIGNMLPAFTRVKSYYGHVTQTKDYGAKSLVVENFYSGKMNPTQALDFIKRGNINYIYVGPIEKIWGADFIKYKLPIEEFYNREGIVIYKVI